MSKNAAFLLFLISISPFAHSAVDLTKKETTVSSIVNSVKDTIEGSADGVFSFLFSHNIITAMGLMCLYTRNPLMFIAGSFIGAKLLKVISHHYLHHRELEHGECNQPLLSMQFEPSSTVVVTIH